MEIEVINLCISQFQTWPSPPPRAKPPGNFLMGKFPPGKKEVQNPDHWAYKNELTPHRRGIFLNYSL